MKWVGIHCLLCGVARDKRKENRCVDECVWMGRKWMGKAAQTHLWGYAKGEVKWLSHM